tara:strand:- start:168 stop:302 length:135 start_codon:yes stop_codon:yes gene_type:complete
LGTNPSELKRTVFGFDEESNQGERDDARQRPDGDESKRNQDEVA